METNKKTITISESKFAEAALTHFNCKIEDIEIRMITANKEAFVIYQDCGYKISTRDALQEYTEFQLTNTQAALLIDFECWIEATQYLIDIKKIMNNLIQKLENAEEVNMLLTALSLSSYAEYDTEAFWRTLRLIDENGEVLGKAMVSAAEEYDGEALIDELTELQILYGKEVYNMHKNGIFETIYIGEDDNDDPEFYIYSAEHEFYK